MVNNTINKNLILFLNGRVGVETLKYLVDSGDKIWAIFISNQNIKIDDEIKSISKVYDITVISDLRKIEDDFFLSELKSNKIDFLISVYWPWLFKQKVLNSVQNTLNFHPSLLPLNRGWYPHVHNLAFGSKAGVTLHQMDSRIDTGPIWFQKEINYSVTDDALTLRAKLENEIFKLFKDKWNVIKEASINLKVQNDYDSTYNSKNFVNQLDLIDLSKNYKGIDLINLLRSRTHGDKSFAYFIHNKKKYFISIKIEASN